MINNGTCVLLHLLACLCGILLSEENMFRLLFQAVVDRMTAIKSLTRLQPFV